MAELKGATDAERNIYQHPNGTWGWRLTVNGDIVATDGNQGYENKEFCRSMANRVVGGEFKDAKRTQPLKDIPRKKN